MATNNFEIERAFFECLERQCLTELNTIKKISEESLSYAVVETQNEAHPTPSLPAIELPEVQSKNNLDLNQWELEKPGTSRIITAEPEADINYVKSRSESAEPILETETDAETPTPLAIEPSEDMSQDTFEENLRDDREPGTFRIITAEPDTGVDDLSNRPEAPQSVLLFKENGPLKTLSTSTKPSVDNAEINSVGGYKDVSIINGSLYKREDLKVTVHDIVIDVEEEVADDLVEDNGTNGEHEDHHNSFG